MTVWMFLTRWGNSLLLVPTASWIGLSLWAVGERPVAWRWVLYFGAALLLVLGTKVAFLGWGIGSRSLNFTGISGHSTLAAAVLPMLAWWLTQERGRTTQLRAVFGAALFAIVVGVSRILLSAHSVSEVVTGPRFARNLRAETDAIADGVADLLAERLRHPFGGGTRRDPARLQHDDLAVARPRLVE